MFHHVGAVKVDLGAALQGAPLGADEHVLEVQLDVCLDAGHRGRGSKCVCVCVCGSTCVLQVLCVRVETGGCTCGVRDAGEEDVEMRADAARARNP